jgi:hypothetical protein
MRRHWCVFVVVSRLVSRDVWNSRLVSRDVWSLDWCREMCGLSTWVSRDARVLLSRLVSRRDFAVS